MAAGVKAAAVLANDAAWGAGSARTPVLRRVTRPQHPHAQRCAQHCRLLTKRSLKPCFGLPSCRHMPRLPLHDRPDALGSSTCASQPPARSDPCQRRNWRSPTSKFACAVGCAGDLLMRGPSIRPASSLIRHTHPTGKPLPPLFNWSPGELDPLPPAAQAALQPQVTQSPQT